jgi:hypothetical protein
LTDAALQTIDGDHEGGSLEHFDEAVEEAFVGVSARGILPGCAVHH